MAWVNAISMLLRKYNEPHESKCSPFLEILGCVLQPSPSVKSKIKSRCYGSYNVESLAGVMAQRVKALVAKPDDLDSILKTFLELLAGT